MARGRCLTPMPRMSQIAEFWRSETECLETMFPRAKVHWIGWTEPCCFGCGDLAPDSHIEEFPEIWNATPFERAHLIDSANGGTNDVSNLVPLCCWCHRRMTQWTFMTKESAAEWISISCRHDLDDFIEYGKDKWFWPKDHRLTPGLTVILKREWGNWKDDRWLELSENHEQLEAERERLRDESAGLTYRRKEWERRIA